MLYMKKLKDFAIQNMSNPVLVFDHQDVLSVCNEAAERLLLVKKGIGLDEFIQGSDLKYILTKERRAQGRTKEFTLTMLKERMAFLLHGQELYDDKGRYVGMLMMYNDISGQERLKEEATYHATRDHLTGLWNRDFFVEMVAKTLRENPDIDFVLIATDIYQFKMFNDVLGRKMGDEVLLGISKGLLKGSRTLWVPSRIAADRFAVLLPKEDYDEQRILSMMHAVLDQKQYSLKLHNYIGVYHITDRSLHVEAMYDRAYMALESIKGDFQKEIAYYEDEMRNRKLKDTLTMEELDYALRSDQLVMYLQPQVNILTETVVGCEALVRWKHPKRGMVPPFEFIPLFEKNGMIIRMDYHVWELACRQIAKWRDEGRKMCSVSVNISARDFYLCDLYDDIVGLVKKYDIDPKQLRLEITESALALDVQEQMEIVKRLQDYGFIVEMDDFGSGYSSLNNLKDITVDIMKLDMNFFKKTAAKERAEKIIESVVHLANKLQMPMIAEGVETKEQVDMLRRIGCTMVQGYYYAAPMPVEEFEAFIEKNTLSELSECFEIAEGKR